MERGTSRMSRSGWTYLLLILILVARSKQETANVIKTTLQELKTLILGRLDDMDQKLLRMDYKCGKVDTTLVEVIKGKVENIELEMVAIGERSSHGLTFIDNAMKGPVNDAKEQGAAILKEIKQLKQKSDLFDNTINTLILNNKQMTSKLNSIDNQLNRTIGSLTYNDNIIIEEVQLLKEGDRSFTLLVNEIKGKVTNIEHEITAIGEKSSHAITLIDNAMQGPVNEIKEQVNAILKETNLIKQKSDMLLLNNVQKEAKLEKIHQQLNQDVARCVGGVILGYQCLKYSQEAADWETAKAACASNSSRLASLADPDAVLAYTIGKYGTEEQFWAGGHDTGKEGNWEWINGSPFDHIPWAENEPNNEAGDENCLAINWRRGYNDAPCTHKLRYICEPVDARCVGGVNIGDQCLTFSLEKQNWDEAKSECVSNSGKLASLADPDAVLAYAIGKYGSDSFWAGGYDIGNEDKAWSAIRNACIRNNNYKIYHGVTIDDCKEKCLDELGMNCQSIDYEPPNQKCYISKARSNSADYTEPCYDGLQEAEYTEILQKTRIWTWENGQPFDQFPWRNSEPNNQHGNQNCLLVNYEGEFDDNNCDDKYGYICEIAMNMDHDV